MHLCRAVERQYRSSNNKVQTFTCGRPMPCEHHPVDYPTGYEHFVLPLWRAATAGAWLLGLTIGFFAVAGFLALVVH